MNQPTKLTLFFVLLPLLIIGLFAISLSYGSVDIPLGDLIHILEGSADVKKSWLFIIQEFRLPKALSAILAGSALSVSGLLMQTLFRNPLAGPFVLGISNGASLGVALLVLSGGVILGFHSESSWGSVIMAILGASLVMTMVMLVSTRVKDNVSLLIIGIMIGSITGAIVTVLQFFSSAESLEAYIIWTFGSLAGIGWLQLKVLAPLVFIGLSLAFIMQKQLNALLLGNFYAQGLGVQIKRTRTIVIIATCILAGSVTAFAGPIAFLGLAVPHIARAILRTSDHKILIPATILIGAALLLACDITAQLPGSKSVLPLNAVTSMVGAPVVIWVVMKAKRIV